MDSIDLVGSRHARLEQYMPAVDSLAVFLYQLDDLAFLIGLYNWYNLVCGIQILINQIRSFYNHKYNISFLFL